MAYRGMIEEYRPESTGEQFAQAFGNLGQAGAQGIQDYFQMQEQKAKNEKTNQLLSELTGLPADSFSGLSPEERRDFIKQAHQQKGQREIEGLKGEGKRELEELKGEGKADKVANLQEALERLNRMREIRKEGNLGIYSKAGLGIFGGETAKAKGEYSQLGKSLISLASTIPIRNRLEFETLGEKIYDPDISDAEAEGVLNAMQTIIEDSLSEYGGNERMEELKEEKVMPMKKSANKKKASLQEIFG